jgi:hypothetical protein
MVEPAARVDAAPFVSRFPVQDMRRDRHRIRYKYRAQLWAALRRAQSPLISDNAGYRPSMLSPDTVNSTYRLLQQSVNTPEGSWLALFFGEAQLQQPAEPG